MARHPAIPRTDELTVGQRAADRMRNGMGSWWFIFGALAFLAAWIAVALTGIAPIDNRQLTILNLVLSCLAALQGGILLIASKRADQISADLAEHDYATDQESLRMLRALHAHAHGSNCRCWEAA